MSQKIAIGVYDPTDESDQVLVWTCEYDDTPENRRHLLEVIRKSNRRLAKSVSWMAMGVFPKPENAKSNSTPTP